MGTKRKITVQCKKCRKQFKGQWDDPGRTTPRLKCPEPDCGGDIALRTVGRAKTK